MATSGSVDFEQTRAEIIEDALALIGVYGVGRTVSSEDMEFCANQLNGLIKSHQIGGLHLWAKEEAYLFIEDNVGEYTLSNAATSAKMALRDGTVITELNGAHAASATSLTVDSTTGMTAADIIGVVLDDDSITWTTIASVDTATTLTLDAGLDSAAADNNNVYTFTSRVNKPLRILGMRRVQGVGDNASSIPMLALSHQEYFDLPNKNMNGNPTHYYYNPDLSAGKLYIWPRPNDPEIHFEVSFERMLEDMDDSANTPDFPQEWNLCLKYQLAVLIAPAFGRSQLLPTLVPLAADLKEKVESYDAEHEHIQIMPNTRG